MSINSFEIGTTYGGRVNVETLTAQPNMSPRSKYFAYTETIQLGDGSFFGSGYPHAVWTWGFMRDDLYAALRVICPGASANVIIRTLKDDYTTYEYYNAIMTWPELDSYERYSGKRQEFELLFNYLTVYTP